jgi:hypothetical protein
MDELSGLKADAYGGERSDKSDPRRFTQDPLGCPDEDDPSMSTRMDSGPSGQPE